MISGGDEVEIMLDFQKPVGRQNYCIRDFMCVTHVLRMRHPLFQKQKYLEYNLC